MDRTQLINSLPNHLLAAYRRAEEAIYDYLEQVEDNVHTGEISKEQAIHARTLMSQTVHGK